jgi:glycosyltransferase involved in cell wall biosynthesis
MTTHVKRKDIQNNQVVSLPPARKLNLVIPFRNERCLLPALLDAVQGLGERLATRSFRVEAVLVDDGSDDTGHVAIRNWASAHAAAFDIRLVRLSRNFGKEYALSAGLDLADGDAVVTMDADLQHPVEVVDRMVEVWLGEGIDVVYAYRERPAREGLGQRLARAAFYRLINATSDAALDPNAGDFRLMSRRACEALRAFGERERLMKGLYGLIGFPTRGVPYVQPPRAAGATKFPPLKLWAMGLDGITSFSVFPLRLTLFMGLALGLLAFGYGVWTIVEKLVFGINAPGYPTLIVIISTIGAGQLIGMGIVGEYLGKVLGEVKRRPLYILESEERIASASSAAGAPVAVAQDLPRSA